MESGDVMKTEVLQGLIEIAHENSIRKAAQNLNIPQQTLNKNISSLETELGVRILERTNQGVQLTDAGTEVYQFAKWCLHEHTVLYEDLLVNSRDEGKYNCPQKEKIVIGCVNTAIQNIMSKAIAQSYRSKNNFEMTVRQDTALQIVDKVMTGEYQMGITIQYQSAKVQYPEFDKSLEFIPIYHSKPYGWVSKKSYLAEQKNLSGEVFSKYNMIRLKDNDGDMVNYIFKHNGMDKLNIILCENIYYATHMLNMNLGIVLDMKTDKHLNLEKSLNDIAIALPMKLQEEYEVATGILVKKEEMKTEIGQVVEYLLQQK